MTAVEGTEPNRFCRAQPTGPGAMARGGGRAMVVAGMPASEGTGSRAASESWAVDCDMVSAMAQRSTKAMRALYQFMNKLIVRLITR